MGQSVASRRARWRFGDLVFSLLAAGLGLGLLFASGRHLFAASAIVPEQTVAQDAVSPIAPSAPHMVAAAIHAPAAAIRVAPKLTILPVRFRSPVRPVVRGRPAAGRTPVHPRRFARVVRPLRNPVISAAPLRAVATVAVRPQRFIVIWRTLRPAETKLRPKGIVRPVVARRASPAGRARVGHRPARPRAQSIIEPPLGYDAQPMLVLAPGTAPLELGDAAIPTIRQRRRH